MNGSSENIRFDAIDRGQHAPACSAGYLGVPDVGPAILYVRFVCQDDDILTTLSGRDAEYDQEDVVEVFPDPVGDEKEYIELQVSPNNGVGDVIYLCTGKPAYDANGL